MVLAQAGEQAAATGREGGAPGRERLSARVGQPRLRRGSINDHEQCDASGREARGVTAPPWPASAGSLRLQPGPQAVHHGRLV